MFKYCFLIFTILLISYTNTSFAENIEDSDNDGLTDYEEKSIYLSDPYNFDTDNDGFNDGYEIKYNYDPNKSSNDKLKKRIQISLSDQSLSYFLGDYIIKNLKISSGIKKTPTPKGEFDILEKKPLVNYRGTDYNFPNTRWNMLFKKATPGNYYIHGAYWHNNFGFPMSHGCINVSYAEMEDLYNWADVGTQIFIW